MAKSHNASNENEPKSVVATLRERAAGVDPLILAAGAAIAGAAAGAFVPRSDAETRLLAPIGAKVTAAAGSFGATARQLLSAELAAVPVVGQMAVDQIDRVLDPIIEVPAEPEAAESERPAHTE